MTKSPFLSFLLSFQMWSGPALDRIISRTMVEGGGDRIKISAHLWFDRELIMLGIFSPKEDKEDQDNDVLMVGQNEKLSHYFCIFHKHHPFFFCIYLIKITHFLLERCPQCSLPTYCRSSPHTSKINIGANTNITENVNTNMVLQLPCLHMIINMIMLSCFLINDTFWDGWVMCFIYENFKWCTCKTRKQIKFEWMDVIHLILNTPLWKCSRVNLDWL